MLKKLTSLFLAMALVLLAFAPYSASAIEVTGEDAVSIDDSGGSVAALYSINGSQTSAKLRQTFANFNVKVDGDTLIQVIPSGIADGTHAVLVTDTEDSSVTVSKFIALNEDGSVRSVVAPSKDTATVTDIYGDTTDLLLDGSFLVMWAVQFNHYVKSGLDFYRPIYTQIFYKNTGGHTVQALQMVGDCVGYEYTYPGFVRVGTSEFSHQMTINPSKPAADKYYVNTNAYREDRVIGNSIGAGGYVIDFYFKVDGNEYEDIADVYIFVKSQ